MAAFGAGGTSGAVVLAWTADPANRLRAEGIGPERVTLLDSGVEPVNPFPPALVWILDRPGLTPAERAPAHVS